VGGVDLRFVEGVGKFTPITCFNREVVPFSIGKLAPGVDLLVRRIGCFDIGNSPPVIIFVVDMVSVGKSFGLKEELRLNSLFSLPTIDSCSSITAVELEFVLRDPISFGVA